MEAYFSQMTSVAKDRAVNAGLQSRLQNLSPQNRIKMEKSAEEFEAIFLTQMLQHMYAGIPVNEDFGGGHAEELFRGMLLDEYGKVFARSGGVGVADQVKRELLGLQEVPK